MKSLAQILENFWKWSGINKEQYAQISDPTSVVEPFFYPEFESLRLSCQSLINTSMDVNEIDDFLTCLALDSEEEVLLMWCKELASDSFIDTISRAGCYHLQREARWQIAALLQYRNTPMKALYLQILANDTDNYVKRRAVNALQQM